MPRPCPTPPTCRGCGAELADEQRPPVLADMCADCRGHRRSEEATHVETLRQATARITAALSAAADLDDDARRRTEADALAPLPDDSRAVKRFKARAAASILRARNKA